MAIRLCLLLFSISAFSQFVLVSDLDDTLKITNGKNIPSMIFNAGFRRKVFAGMPLLYNSLDKKKIEAKFLLSASPGVLRYNVKRLVKKHKLKFDNIYLRNFREIADKRAYKLRKIELIISQTKGQLILLGDNQSIDDEIYLEMRRRYPQRIAKIFIHKIHDLPAKEGVVEYITTVELLKELSFLLTKKDSKEIFLKVKNGSKKRIIPRFAYCPKTKWMNELSLSQEELSFEEEVINYCLKRS